MAHPSSDGLAVEAGYQQLFENIETHRVRLENTLKSLHNMIGELKNERLSGRIIEGVPGGITEGILMHQILAAFGGNCQLWTALFERVKDVEETPYGRSIKCQAEYEKICLIHPHIRNFISMCPETTGARNDSTATLSSSKQRKPSPYSNNNDSLPREPRGTFIPVFQEARIKHSVGDDFQHSPRPTKMPRHDRGCTEEQHERRAFVNPEYEDLLRAQRTLQPQAEYRKRHASAKLTRTATISCLSAHTR